jgi:TPR repeat protein
LNLARSYEKGLGVEKDEPKANELFLIACDSGLYFACYYMGLKFEKGVSVEKDDIKAKSLYRVACDNGIQRACGHLN